MTGPVSIYLRDDTLRKLDAAVAQRADKDRAQGLAGRQITNRSKFIERLIETHLASNSGPSIEEIRHTVAPLAKEYGARKVSLFGSRARGDASNSSDVDILLEKGAIKGLGVLDFQDELARRLGCPVDIVTTAGASERFLNKIKRDEVILYEAV